jgi:hypothetical protein
MRIPEKLRMLSYVLPLRQSIPRGRKMKNNYSQSIKNLALELHELVGNEAIWGAIQKAFDLERYPLELKIKELQYVIDSDSIRIETLEHELGE